jgi:hypothetical protein
VLQSFLWVVAGLVVINLIAASREKNARLGPGAAALANASHGAAMIVLALLAWSHLGRLLPAWFPLAALATVFWGSLRLCNGARLSKGFRDPELFAGACVKCGIGIAVYVLAWNPPSQFPLVGGITLALLAETAPYGGWVVATIAVWCVVTGVTKAILLSRGLPTTPLPPRGTSRNAGFAELPPDGRL